MNIEEELTDAIYEAGAIPELWPQTLQKLSELSDALGGLLFVTDMKTADWIASDGILAIVRQYFREGWAEKNPRPKRLANLRHAGFIHDLDVFSEEELENEPVYRDFYRKVGFGWGAGTMFQMPSGDNIVFRFECPYEGGPVRRETIERLNRLRPHLARASLLTWRMGMKTSQAVATALQSLGLPAAVLSEAGRVEAANALFGDLLPNCFQDRRERLMLTHARSDELLKTAIARLTSRVQVLDTQSIPLAATNERPALVLHLMPVRRQARDVFSRGSIILVAMPVDRSRVPHAEIIEALFDLTPSEAAIARAVGEGQGLKAIASARGVSVETVRVQIKSVFAKTGTHRQADLSKLLSGLMPGLDLSASA